MSVVPGSAKPATLTQCSTYIEYIPSTDVSLVMVTLATGLALSSLTLATGLICTSVEVSLCVCLSQLFPVVLSHTDTVQYVRRVCSADVSPVITGNYFTTFDNHLQYYLVTMASMVSVDLFCECCRFHHQWIVCKSVCIASSALHRGR